MDKQGGAQDPAQKAAMFDAMAEGGLCGIVVYQDEVSVYCNRKAEEILGRPRERIIGVSIWEIVGEGLKEAMLPNLRSRMKGDDPGVKQYSFVSKEANGTTNIQFSVSSTVYGGRPAGLAVLIDVTEMLRRRAEAERSGELFYAIFDSSRDAMMILDGRDLGLIDVNAQLRRFFHLQSMGLREIEAALHRDMN